jgi:BCD family chlorophyll transporter-like MFS transporter
VLLNGRDPLDVAWWGTLAGLPAFAAIIAAGPMGQPSLFVAGTWLAGLGAGLFGHGTLTATMRSAPREQVGLALGAWGAVQATAAGVAVALGGIIRDLITAMPGAEAFRPEAPYTPVFSLELILIFAALVSIMLLKTRTARHNQTTHISNRQVRPDTPAVITEPARPGAGRTEREAHEDPRLTAH